MNGSVKLGTPSACAHASMSSALSDAMIVDIYKDIGEYSRQHNEKKYTGAKGSSSVPSATSFLSGTSGG
jgi:hypothetical protein